MAAGHSIFLKHYPTGSSWRFGRIRPVLWLGMLNAPGTFAWETEVWPSVPLSRVLPFGPRISERSTKALESRDPELSRQKTPLSIDGSCYCPQLWNLAVTATKTVPPLSPYHPLDFPARHRIPESLAASSGWGWGSVPHPAVRLRSMFVVVDSPARGLWTGETMERLSKGTGAQSDTGLNPGPHPKRAKRFASDSHAWGT